MTLCQRTRSSSHHCSEARSSRRKTVLLQEIYTLYLQNVPMRMLWALPYRVKLFKNQIMQGCLKNKSFTNCLYTVKLLDSVHNLGLLVSIDAYWTSPINSLCVETNEPLVSDGRTSLTCVYVLKIYSLPKRLASILLLNAFSEYCSSVNPKQSNHYYYTFKRNVWYWACLTNCLMLPQVTIHYHHGTPILTVYNFTLTHFRKIEMPEEDSLQEYLPLNEKYYKSYIELCTDGSKWQTTHVVQ